MKKLKNSKGITLIALIITVIVLMILAGATVYMIMSGDNIFEKAKLAVQKYSQKSDQEKNDLEQLEMAFGMAPETVGPTITDLSQLEGDWIPLYTAGDLAAVASGDPREIKGITYTMATDANYIVMQHINLADREWTPISGFLGNFDGNNCIIDNLNSTTGTSLFGNISGDLSGKEIKNIIFNNINISTGNASASQVGTALSTGIENTGSTTMLVNNIKVKGAFNQTNAPVAGLIYVASNVEVRDCSVVLTSDLISVNDSAPSSGFIRTATNVTIKNCNFEGNVVGPTYAQMPYAGFIVNATDVTIDGLKYKGNVTSLKLSGGALIYSATGNTSINNCHFTGDVSSSADVTGFVSGGTTNEITNSSFSGNITSSSGTASGFISGATTNTISDSLFRGTLTATSSSSSLPGRIYGFISGGTTNTISNSSFVGDMNAYISIRGLAEKATVSSCFVNANMNLSCTYGQGTCYGLLGSSGNWEISDSYALMNSNGYRDEGFVGSGVTNSYYITRSNDSISRHIRDASGSSTYNLTDASMKTKSTFTNLGFDFENTWAIDANKNQGYPYLKALESHL